MVSDGLGRRRGGTGSASGGLQLPLASPLVSAGATRATTDKGTTGPHAAKAEDQSRSKDVAAYAPAGFPLKEVGSEKIMHGFLQLLCGPDADAPSTSMSSDAVSQPISGARCQRRSRRRSGLHQQGIVRGYRKGLGSRNFDHPPHPRASNSLPIRTGRIKAVSGRAHVSSLL